MFTRIRGVAAALSVFVCASAHAAISCNDVKAALAGVLADMNCFDSADLTTHNTAAPPDGPTTPANNSLSGLPGFAFTPITDRSVI